MAAIHEEYCIPKLRKLVKSVRSACWGCKRFQASPLTVPRPEPLPTDRTIGGAAFKVIGRDFAGSLKYKQHKKSKGKAYRAIFSCSLSRAVHLQLMSSMETSHFITCFKRLIACRGRQRVISSDNGGTFIKAGKWLRQLREHERLQGLLDGYNISWKFNLSHAPWWGGQFKRLIGIMTSAMYKVIGEGVLSSIELSKVLLDVETQTNQRPLSYLEDDVEMPILSPSTFLFQRTNHLPEEEAWRFKEVDLRKCAKYLKACRDSLWRRWQKEYLTSLRERHNMMDKTAKFQPKIGDVLIVKSKNKNRGHWPLAMVNEIVPGKDENVRAVQLKTANGIIERPVQHLYPLELTCDRVCDKCTNKQPQHL
ncbi:uncharacterized protein LOC141890758 [Acropora palmata]|uniref:uncharacterized protein LOC141890758 n=1 Tax=Acropora palmata TaxID=6131 RepID=UPI003DA04CC7